MFVSYLNGLGNKKKSNSVRAHGLVIMVGIIYLEACLSTPNLCHLFGSNEVPAKVDHVLD